MMTPRKKKSETTKVRTSTSTLTPLEEKVLRMRRGLTAPDDLALEQVGQDHPEITAQLREIEERALAAVGARQTNSKRRIVSALRQKSR